MVITSKEVSQEMRIHDQNLERRRRRRKKGGFLFHSNVNETSSMTILTSMTFDYSMNRRV